MKKLMSLNSIKSYLDLEENTQTAKLAITPKQAKFLLKSCNKLNRRLNRQHVDKLKRDMENNNWYNDIDYIGFNSKGLLANGQHRLKALSEANVESVTLKFDFDVEQHISMDTGNTRKYSDQVTISKKSGTEILPTKYKYIITAGLKLNNPKMVLSNTELNNIWNEYYKELQICDEHNLFNVGNKAGTTVKSSLFWAYLSGVDINILAHIAKVLRTGITEAETDIPVIRLRDALVDLRGNAKILDVKRAEYTQQCIYNVLQGSTSNRLPANPIMHYQNYPFLERIK